MSRMPFATWLQVRHYCETHAYVYYQAPMDRNPAVCAVRRVFKNGKIRLETPTGYRFTADEGHLSRITRNE